MLTIQFLSFHKLRMLKIRSCITRLTLISFFSQVENAQDKKLNLKIDPDVNITDFVRILFKGQASYQRAKESPIRAEQVGT